MAPEGRRRRNGPPHAREPERRSSRASIRLAATKKKRTCTAGNTCCRSRRSAWSKKGERRISVRVTSPAAVESGALAVSVILDIKRDRVAKKDGSRPYRPGVGLGLGRLGVKVRTEFWSHALGNPTIYALRRCRGSSPSSRA